MCNILKGVNSRPWSDHFVPKDSTSWLYKMQATSRTTASATMTGSIFAAEQTGVSIRSRKSGAILIILPCVDLRLVRATDVAKDLRINFRYPSAVLQPLQSIDIISTYPHIAKVLPAHLALSPVDTPSQALKSSQ